MNTIIFEKLNGYAKITLNRPDKLNALNDELISELSETIDKIEKDMEIRALLITGSGDKAFAAGADIKELHDNDIRSGKLFSEKGTKVLRKIEALNIPVVAAVNGFALGGGCELAMACHLRFASENAKLGQPEINLGTIPGYGGTQRLPRLIGKAKATDFILTGEMISALDAEQIGLVNKVYPHEQLISECEKFIAKILTKSPLAIAAALKSIAASVEMNPLSGLEYESSQFGSLCDTEDFEEGTRAFLEKRKPEFKGK